MNVTLSDTEKCMAVVRRVADYYGLKVEDLLDTGRTQPVVTVVAVAMRCCRDVVRTDEQISRIFNCSRSNVCTRCHRIEEYASGDPLLRADLTALRSGLSSPASSATFVSEYVKRHQIQRKAASSGPSFRQCECGAMFELKKTFDKQLGCPACREKTERFRQSESELAARRLKLAALSPLELCYC